MSEQRTDSTFTEWIGQSIESNDDADGATLRRLAATLDRDEPLNFVPPLGHWLFHLPETPHAMLGGDGHPARGGFLPPIGQPRRMWAGGRLRFAAPVPVGSAMTKRTTITNIVEKEGVVGKMVFVTLRHVISVAEVEAIVEDQDLVYLPSAAPAPPKLIQRPAPSHQRTMIADEALLFRFSALTFNAHRIHYDLGYTRNVELYPALVVQGPLQAMLLLNFARDNGAAVEHFAFRARAPLYVASEFTLNQAGDQLWISDNEGLVTMTADIRP